MIRPQTHQQFATVRKALPLERRGMAAAAEFGEVGEAALDRVPNKAAGVGGRFCHDPPV